MRKALLASIVILLASIAPVVATAQGFIPAGSPPWVYADNYGRWALNGQSPNNYTFQPASICQITQLNFTNKPTFFAFASTNALAPVFIDDVNGGNSEVVTPGTAATQTQESCAVNLSPANSHTTFTLQSGTGGLQEALNSMGSGSIVYLTPEWYKLVGSLSSQNATLAAQITPAKLIYNAVGVATLVDITTSPATVYVPNGSHYTALMAPSGFPNLAVSSFTGISAPIALTTVGATCLTNGGGCITTATTGGTIPASATYRLAATYVDAAGGETLISTDSASGATIETGSGTATNTITVTSPAASAGAVGWRLYMTAASGSAGAEILYTPTCTQTNNSAALQNVLNPATVCPIGTPATITAIVTGTATVPIIANAYPRVGSGAGSGTFPPFAVVGTIASTNTGTIGLINFPAGWLNVLGRTFDVCGNGYATTNGTSGTVTLKQTLSSIPGVTTITPFSAISGTIGASDIQMPFDFCVTYTTASTGTSGTLETHGFVLYSVAGAAVGTASIDFTFAVSSAVDLTKQDQLAVTLTPTTAGLTAEQLRQLTVYVAQ